MLNGLHTWPHATHPYLNHADRQGEQSSYHISSGGDIQGPRTNAQRTNRHCVTIDVMKKIRAISRVHVLSDDVYGGALPVHVRTQQEHGLCEHSGQMHQGTGSRHWHAGKPQRGHKVHKMMTDKLLCSEFDCFIGTGTSNARQQQPPGVGQVILEPEKVCFTI